MRIKKSFITGILIFIVMILATVIAVLYARGYRLDFTGTQEQFIAGTGLLVLTSNPDGARVFINDNLTTATNDTINLPPGEYDIRIEKDGFYPWKKKVTLKKEAVTKTEAVLFPSAPKLEAVTLIGAEEPIVDTSGSLLAYKVSSSSAQANGIYVLPLSSRPLFALGSATRQIASNSFDTFSNAELELSPNGQELLATIPTSTTSGGLSRVYLIKTDSFNQTPQNVTLTANQIRATWTAQQKEEDEKYIQSLAAKARPFAQKNFANIQLSPENDKVLYVASESATMPHFITPPLPSTNSTPETRELKKGNTYVYQIKEDKNYLLYEPQTGEGEQTPTFTWHPTSNHLFFIKDRKVMAMEFDGGNKTTIYAGPFLGNFLYPWPDASGLIIRTNFNDESVPPNLYRISLK